jgi:hypothetical protein
MNFKREEFYGENFEWFGVDKTGYIAEFDSGYAPIPNAVFEDERKYQFLFRFFKELPEITSSRLTTKAQAEQDIGYARYDKFLEKSQKGYFVYTDPDYSSVYELISIPNKKLHISELPIHIQAFLEPLRFHTVDFETTELLDIRSYSTFAVDD